ncbi:chemotaxis protein CheB [Microlunatus spumicola]|uniref:protein-glutamate methylesterase n=1 Tax=Microlunatus spumicola TaxID=81499 RepID=A0ABP6WQ87_9ACTN
MPHLDTDHDATAEPSAGPRADAVLLVGGSAGSLEPLVDLVSALPAELPAAVLVTQHIGEHARSRLPLILQRATALPVAAAADGEPLRAGRVYVAPPGRHLLVDAEGLRLSSGPRVNRQRPSVDVMLASAASRYGPRTVAVVLSGVLDDGAVGAALVARAGGTVLVQADADFTSMPAAALAAAPGARAVPAPELGRSSVAALTLITQRTTDEEARMSARIAAAHEHEHEHEHRPATMVDAGDPDFLAAGEARLTRLACPDCGGAMAEVDLPQITYFACHIGHRFSPQTLAAAQAEASEAKLWAAVAALEEQSAVLGRLTSTGPADDSGLLAYAAEVSGRARQLRREAESWATSPPEVLAPGSDVRGDVLHEEEGAGGPGTARAE